MDLIRTLQNLDWEASGKRTLGVILAVVLVLVGARVLRTVIKRLTIRILAPRPGAQNHGVQVRRSLTLLPLLLEIERYVIYLLAAITVLAQIGVDTGAILASVGVVGLALGFGAQNLVKDMIGGFFLLFDGLVAVGDVVRVNETTSGTVERVGLRNTQLRDYSGLLWVIPNGDLRQFGNFNRGWTRAVIDVGVDYAADVRKALALMREVGAAWAKENPDKVLEAPEVQAVLGMRDGEVRIRLAVKTAAMAHWDAERELRLRLKEVFQAQGIDLPYPSRVVVNRGRPGS